MREENQSTWRKPLGVRLRLTETQPAYIPMAMARVEPGLQMWEVQLITAKPSRIVCYQLAHVVFNRTNTSLNH